jgi:purine-cytosine permease-like protein
MDTVVGVVVVVALVAIPAYLVWTMVTQIRSEMRRQHLRRVWANFGLSVVLCILFFATWGAHAVAQWQDYADDQHQHGEQADAGGFLVAFGESTLENWQSEFLQLFSFVVLAAMYVHRDSAESRDSEDRMEALLERIADKLDA